MASSPKDQLKELLTDLFQLNNTDLDFGIYRIMNLKAAEVKQFINEQLDERVEAVKNKIFERQVGDIKAELEVVKRKLATDFQVDFHIDGDLQAKADQYKQLALFQEPYRIYIETKNKLDALRVSEDTERSIYNELYRFFDRYYEGGDFISKPRAGKDNYMIPYEGEEVKLYWANYDQYYIKTGDNFKNYIFNNQSADPEKFTQVEFRIIDADVAQNNNKDETGRLFVPAENPVEWIQDERKLLVKFYYRVPDIEEKRNWGEKQSVKTENKGINQKLFSFITEQIRTIADPELILFHSKTRTNSKNEAYPIIQYHIDRYTNINKFDYFIHKNLKAFLSRELDSYLKNEVLSIQFLSPEWDEQEVMVAIRNNVLKASVIRDIAIAVIDFMSELENFQKRLFEKKKFVVQSDYCLTLDRIPLSVYNDIVDYILSDEGKLQITEWINLNFINTETIVSAEYLKNNDKLILDTAFLSEKLKWSLLASLDDIDHLNDGLLINSENWQALNFLYRKYLGKIKVVYIDPPYNTEIDRQKGKFVYKDSFEHSTWLCMIKDRVVYSSKLLEHNGVHFQSIGDDELHRSISLYESSGYKVLGNFVWKRTRTGGHLSNTVNKLSEYVIIADKGNSGQVLYGGKADPEESQPMNKSGNSIKCLTFRPGLITFINEDINEFEILPGVYGTVASKVTVLDTIVVQNKINQTVVRLEGNFTWTQDFLNSEIDRGATIIIKDIRRMLPRFFRESEFSKPFPSMPNEDIQVGTNEDGSALLFSMFNTDNFDYPKPINLLESLIESKTYFTNDGYILDYFSGSGTTGHAVISLNRKTEGNRKYILVEMGNYFNSVTKPRIQKSIFSNKWKDGHIEVGGTGISQIFQYIKLEQYEDTLNNIVFKSYETQLNIFDIIRYQFRQGVEGSDSLLNLEKFSKPFSYTMKIVQQNEPREDTPIDLITTFNFLLGIEIIRYKIETQSELEYRIVIGKKGMQNYIIVWREFNEASIDLETERDWITTQEWYTTTSNIYCNGDNAFNAYPIEPEFIRLLNEPLS